MSNAELLLFYEGALIEFPDNKYLKKCVEALKKGEQLPSPFGENSFGPDDMPF